MRFQASPFVEPSAVYAMAGVVVHGSGIVPLMTDPPCFLDVAAGRLVDFDEAGLSLAMQPEPPPAWYMPAVPKMEWPHDDVVDAFRFRCMP